MLRQDQLEEADELYRATIQMLSLEQRYEEASVLQKKYRYAKGTKITEEEYQAKKEDLEQRMLLHEAAAL